MSFHDSSLIVLSIIGTFVVLRKLAVVQVPLRGIFGFEVSAIPGLEKALTADEVKYLEGQAKTFPRVVVHDYRYSTHFKVSYQRHGLAVTETMEYVVTRPMYPLSLWECDLADSAPGLMGIFDQPQLVVQFERNRNRIVLGTVGGRFGKDMIGCLKPENVLADLRLDPPTLRALNPKIKKNSDSDVEWSYWDFIVEHNDEKIRWFAHCSDVDGLVNRWRFF